MGIASTQQLKPETWVDKHRDALFRFTLTRVREKDIAEDLVQETFLSAVRSKARFKGHSSEKTWLFGILKHKVIDYFRKLKTASRLCPPLDSIIATENPFESDGGWQTAPAHWSTDPSTVFDNRERKIFTLKGLQWVPVSVFLPRG